MYRPGRRVPHVLFHVAWDSTGEEGVYAWSAYFNDTKTATNSLNAILAYQPTVAHWGYNGNARPVPVFLHVSTQLAR
jgi:hypothetical protein